MRVYCIQMVKLCACKTPTGHVNVVQTFSVTLNMVVKPLYLNSKFVLFLHFMTNNKLHGDIRENKSDLISL